MRIGSATHVAALQLVEREGGVLAPYDGDVHGTELLLGVGALGGGAA